MPRERAGLLKNENKKFIKLLTVCFYIAYNVLNKTADR